MKMKSENSIRRICQVHRDLLKIKDNHMEDKIEIVIMIQTMIKLLEKMTLCH